MADIKYEIKEELEFMAELAKGWKKELNLISFRYLINSEMKK